MMATLRSKLLRGWTQSPSFSPFHAPFLPVPLQFESMFMYAVPVGRWGAPRCTVDVIRDEIWASLQRSTHRPPPFCALCVPVFFCTDLLTDGNGPHRPRCLCPRLLRHGKLEHQPNLKSSTFYS